MFPCKFDFPQLKQKLISSIKNRITDLEKFMILRNLDMKEKSQNWMETKNSVQSPLQKLIFGNKNQNLQEIRCRRFLFFSKYVWFSYYFLSNLSPIVCRKKSFVIHKISLLSNLSSNHTQLASKSKTAKETVEKGVKYVQSL